jgi:hypothetical protein
MEADNNCLELAALPSGLALRESEESGVVLSTTPARLVAFLAAVRVDEFRAVRPTQ